MTSQLHYQAFLAKRAADDLSARKDEQRQNDDPALTQCVIAYVNYRAGGGQGDFDPFKREWYQTQTNGATDGMAGDSTDGA